MKDQYFADVNDFRKYGLLRVLGSGGSIRTGVCWMLTEDDGRSDGRHITYLRRPEKWRLFDPELFDFLKRSVEDRRVSQIEQSGLLPGAVFWSDLLECSNRRAYFAKAARAFQDCNLVFLDPDNGLAVKSVGLGHPKSPKYVYPGEVEGFWNLGKSVLVYQHFARQSRDDFVAGLVDRLRVLSGTVISIRTASVLYLLLPQPDVVDSFVGKVEGLSGSWPGQFLVRVWC